MLYFLIVPTIVGNLAFTLYVFSRLVDNHDYCVRHLILNMWLLLFAIPSMLVGLVTFVLVTILSLVTDIWDNIEDSEWGSRIIIRKAE